MAAFEVPLSSEADREQFIALLRAAAALEGMHVDAESSEDLKTEAQVSPNFEMTMKAAGPRPRSKTESLRGQSFRGPQVRAPPPRMIPSRMRWTLFVASLPKGHANDQLRASRCNWNPGSTPSQITMEPRRRCSTFSSMMSFRGHRLQVIPAE